MRMHKGNLSQWMGRLSHVVSIMAINVLVKGEGISNKEIQYILDVTIYGFTPSYIYKTFCGNFGKVALLRPH